MEESARRTEFLGQIRDTGCHGVICTSVWPFEESVRIDIYADYAGPCVTKPTGFLRDSGGEDSLQSASRSVYAQNLELRSL